MSTHNQSLGKRLSKLLKTSLKNPYFFLARVIMRPPFYKIIPDRPYLKICYRAYTGLKLNLDNPRSFNEKMQWLKLNDKKDWYWKIADKVEVREYVKDLIGEQYLIPKIAVYTSVDEIEFDRLPKQFVLKCTHDSGTTVVCSDKSTLDIDEAKGFLRKRMNQNYYYLHREFPYKNIRPRIVCEAFLTPDGNSTPHDIKIFCFHGVPKLIQVDTDRFTGHLRYTKYPDWTAAPFHIDRKYLKPDMPGVERPANLDEMLDVSVKLSKEFKFIRVDLYSVNNKVYFGELSFYQGTGYDPIYPHEYNIVMGDWLDLSR
jgi:hypothetical protein